MNELLSLMPFAHRVGIILESAEPAEVRGLLPWRLKAAPPAACCTAKPIPASAPFASPPRPTRLLGTNIDGAPEPASPILEFTQKFR